MANEHTGREHTGHLWHKVIAKYIIKTHVNQDLSVKSEDNLIKSDVFIWL